MIRVLFVDDEPHVLDGLRVALRAQRRRWTMAFALGGEAAVALVAREPFDVVVTDMRMPRVDGCQVLAATQAHLPGAARIVLSGFAEVEATLRALPVAHQFVAKPCEPAILVNVIDRACQLHALVANSAVRDLVGRVTTLPSPSKTYQAVMTAAADVEATAAQVASVIERDVAMTAKILQFVSSAFFGPRQRITSIQNAIVYLGFNMVRSLVLSAEVFRSGAEPLSAIEQHSLAVAQVAAHVAGAGHDADDAYLAGMLHDVGKLVARSAWPERSEATERAAADGRRPLDEVEAEILGASHAEVGGYLLGLWGLPYDIVEAVANHHRPERVEQPRFDVLAALYVADSLVHEAAGAPLPEGFDAYLERLAVAHRAAEWRARAQAVWAEAIGLEKEP